MPLPPLANWDTTRIGLHQAAQVVGAIRKLDASPLPNYLHYALEVVPNGLTSGKLATGGELVLDFRQAAILYTPPLGAVWVVPLEGHTQVTLMDALLAAMDKTGYPAQPDRAKITGTEPLTVDAQTAVDYHEALYTIYTVMARFRARLFGPMSRMVVWPHGFDLSFLWFARGFDEGNDPHLNFGFSPGSPGFTRPYIYAYAHPKPEGMFDYKPPHPARWNTEPFTGIVLDYDALAAMSDAESTLEGLLLDIHAGLSRLM